SGGGFRGAVDRRLQPVGLCLAVAVAAAPGAGGRACRQRLIRSQEVCACVSVPASQSRSSAVCQGLPLSPKTSPASTVRTLLAAGRLGSVVDTPLNFTLLSVRLPATQ